jgi:dCMP deaminase
MIISDDIMEPVLKIAVKMKKTRWDVLHAGSKCHPESCTITQSCEGATLYITLSPCKECSKLIHQSGIKRVVYHNGYRDDSGIQFLIKAGVEEHIPVLEE